MKFRSTRSSGRVSTSVVMVVIGLRLPRTTPLQIEIIHQSGHPITTNLDALTIELAPDLLDAVDAEVIAVDPGDLDLQFLVTLASD